MRVVQRSGRRVRTTLLCRPVCDPRLAPHDRARNVPVDKPKAAALVSEGEEASGDTPSEDGKAVVPARPVARHGDLTECDGQQRCEFGGQTGEEVLRLVRRRANETREPSDIRPQSGTRISLAAR